MKKIINYLLPAVCLVAIVFSVAAFNKAGAATPAGQPVDLTYAAEKALPSVVHIKYVQNSKVKTIDVQSDPFSDFFFDPFGGFFGRGNGGSQKRQVQTPRKTATGSGVIISADGYIVTNNHVVDGADELTVTLNDNQEYSARIIGADKTTDLALIKIDGKNLPAIVIANSDDIKVGEWVLAVGNPLGLNNTVTAGIVSAKARSLGANSIESFIQTDAAINAGNSGGALVNTRGELVGINAMLYSQTGSYSGYGFAIPTTIMNKVVDDLKKYGTVQRAWVGIQGNNVKDYVDSQKDQGKDIDLGTMEGIYVAKVLEDGAASDAGIKEGDVIVAVDGEKVTRMAELQEIIARKRPGDKISITYLHEKKKHTETVTLKNEQGTVKVVKHADLDVLGANFREVTDDQKKRCRHQPRVHHPEGERPEHQHDRRLAEGRKRRLDKQGACALHTGHLPDRQEGLLCRSAARQLTGSHTTAMAQQPRGARGTTRGRLLHACPDRRRPAGYTSRKPP